ncbi:hypothetical protein O181_008097 [Austropuccinia psidii MF-1]|uniref:Uncharacterized protein n=1 Tax=Austropuccinia psidii MF-1 TaxID=1389203 RepID=A0A9Q3BN67_9BASI|nr:hypothetical protein [Austropuccinia psidii MF-1]
MQFKIVPNNSREDRRPERTVLKYHKCGRTFHLASTCTKNTKINEVEVIGDVQCAEEKEKSQQEYKISEDTPAEDYAIENSTAFIEVTEFHTHLPQYSEDFCNLISVLDARMCKNKPARGKGYMFGASLIKSVLLNDIEAKFNLDTGEFYICVGKTTFKAYFPNRRTIYYQ